MFKFVYHEIFNHKNSFEIIASLTQAAMFHIIFQCPYAYVKRIERCKDYFAAAIRRGVIICVIIQEPSREPITEAEKRSRQLTEQAIQILLDIGVHVSYRKKIHEKVAIFDELYICDGSINFLSQSDTSERMNMFESPQMVREAIQFHDIRCAVCASMRLSDDAIEVMRLNFVSFRKALGLSHDSVSVLSNVSHGTIANFESGNDRIGLELLDRLSRTFGFVVRCVPNFMTAIMDRRIHEFSSKPIDRKFMHVPESFNCARVLGTTVNERRRVQLLTQDGLFARSGVKRQTISDLERGSANIQLRSLDKICHELDMSLRLIPISLLEQVDRELHLASDASIAHALKMYNALVEHMRKCETAQLLRLGRAHERQKQQISVYPSNYPIAHPVNPI